MYSTLLGASFLAILALIYWVVGIPLNPPKRKDEFDPLAGPDGATGEGEGHSASPAPLVDRIFDEFSESDFHDQKEQYLPNGAFSTLINQHSITSELHKVKGELTKPLAGKSKRAILKICHPASNREELASWILQNAARVFAITLQCELEPISLVFAMSLFRHHNFTDRKLPIPDLAPDSRTFPPNLCGGDVKLWSRGRIRNFYDNQWKYLVPVFSTLRYDYNLLFNNYIFPFTRVDATPKTGAFSFVHKIRIHHDHQKHPNMELVRSVLIYIFIVAVYVVAQHMNNSNDE